MASYNPFHDLLANNAYPYDRDWILALRVPGAGAAPLHRERIQHTSLIPIFGTWHCGCCQFLASYEDTDIWLCTTGALYICVTARHAHLVFPSTISTMDPGPVFQDPFPPAAAPHQTLRRFYRLLTAHLVPPAGL